MGRELFNCRIHSVLLSPKVSGEPCYISIHSEAAAIADDFVTASESFTLLPGQGRTPFQMNGVLIITKATKLSTSFKRMRYI